jgi:hypothetical protein
MIMMSGSADLEDITITENGEYESVDHDGFGVVTVEVPTMVECAEEVAEILGVDTSQEWDCDDIKTKAQEVVDENEEMQECCDEVLDVIHDYDPTYDPHPVPPDPTNPTIPEKIQEIIDDESGYELPIPPIPPVNPDDPDPFPFIGSNKVTDEDLNASITLGCIDYYTQTFQPVVNITYPYQEMAQSAIQLTYTRGGVRTTEWYAVSGVAQLWRSDQWQKITSCTVESDGTIKTKLSQYIHGYVYDFDGLPITKAEYAGYGDPSHTYKVTNT